MMRRESVSQPIGGRVKGRARLLFRKPFFPGQEYVIRAQLFRRNNLTHMQARYHLLDGAERESERINVRRVRQGD